MSGLELAGFVLGALGPVEQAINISAILRTHFKALGENERVIQQLITLLNHFKHDMKQLHSQLQRHQSLIPESNYQIIQTNLVQMKSRFKEIHLSLSTMNKSVGRKFIHFFKAAKWSKNCQNALKQLQETQYNLVQINFFLGNTAVMSSIIERTNHNIDQARIDILQAVDSQEESFLRPQVEDTFEPYFDKLPIPFASKPDFHSIDLSGNPSKIEGKLKQKLLNTAEYKARVLSILGPGGVGKTTAMRILTRDQQLKDYFSDGTYYITLGADARVESFIDYLVDITRKSGGFMTAAKLKLSESIDDAILILSDWLKNKKYLFLVDDIWEQKELGMSMVSLLKGMISVNEDASMVFTTRDPSIAIEAAESFRLDCRDPQGPESREILFQHARQNSELKYQHDTENAIKALLNACAGLPVAHAVVGKGVLQYSTRRNVGQEDAWRIYARRQESMLKRRADEYDCMYTVFRGAVRVLEESSENKKGKRLMLKYSYREMHRSLCVLEKQQWAPLEMLGCLWNIESTDDVRSVCEDLVRVGLADWYNKELTSEQRVKREADIEGITIHDLLHDFATREAKGNDETEEWHRRLIEGYGMHMEVKKIGEDDYEEWWKNMKWSDERDGGYLMNNLCRHLHLGWYYMNGVVTLATRPEWIRVRIRGRGMCCYP